MAAKSISPNKAKIARRVIEVLEYFDDNHREATVMDLVRQFGRPQSSTSELLHSLVEIGLLHKRECDRTYRLTPRAALLGTGGQTELLREGTIIAILDDLAVKSTLPVILTSMVGMNAQIVSWRAGLRDSLDHASRRVSGLKEPLFLSSSGLLMLSTLEPSRCDAMVRRMNAEASSAQKFFPCDVLRAIENCRNTKQAIGPAGFETNAQAVSCLLPRQPFGRPLAISLLRLDEDIFAPEEMLSQIQASFSKYIRESKTDNVMENLVRAA